MAGKEPFKKLFLWNCASAFICRTLALNASATMGELPNCTPQCSLESALTSNAQHVFSKRTIYGRYVSEQTDYCCGHAKLLVLRLEGVDGHLSYPTVGLTSAIT